ncbi:hypothetical protein Nwi_3088 [Nitrobacter winogradskyi Nb-255]|uniref:Uncharacterized protein n=1 Tax=Nitrobacter winogradskyi (strain ATCC 25391 / DSM 10237 / CIP 104748 / NCIMB 11846 / Nb-255) TaxID=323098 RepID=Q3SN06_NITWN|nr:hypothetical protein Nwi_3088 [Nitrobacter winogradskyi Nb-255]
MAIPDYARTNFNTMLRAAGDGNLALMECLDAATREPRYVLCAVGRDGGDYVFTPLGHLACPPSGLLRQFRGFREGRISGSSQPIWSADETEIRAGESTGRAGREGHPPGNAPAVLG